MSQNETVRFLLDMFKSQGGHALTREIFVTCRRKVIGLSACKHKSFCTCTVATASLRTMDYVLSKGLKF